MREEPSDSYEYKGYVIEIWPDTDSSDPRKEFENLGTVACWHRRYNLGDVQPKCDPDEYLRGLVSGEADEKIKKLDDRLYKAEWYWRERNDCPLPDSVYDLVERKKQGIIDADLYGVSGLEMENTRRYYDGMIKDVLELNPPLGWVEIVPPPEYIFLSVKDLNHFRLTGKIRQYVGSVGEEIADSLRKQRDRKLKVMREAGSGNLIALDVYLYDHSGITINTTGFSCPWDSGQIGFIWMTMAQARKEWSGTDEEIRKQAEKYLRGEVETYDMYLRGDVYGYIVKDEDDEEIDSLWGCWGYDYTKKEAENYVDGLAREAAQEMEEEAAAS